VVGWLFVAAIGYHALLAANDARQAGTDHSWASVIGYGLIAVAAGALVIAACVHEVRSARRRARRQV